MSDVFNYEKNFHNRMNGFEIEKYHSYEYSNLDKSTVDQDNILFLVQNQYQISDVQGFDHQLIKDVSDLVKLNLYPAKVEKINIFATPSKFEGLYGIFGVVLAVMAFFTTSFYLAILACIFTVIELCVGYRPDNDIPGSFY